MKLFFAKTVSVILNPFLVALLGLYVLVYRTSNSDMIYALKWMIFSSLFVALSVGFIFFGRYRGFFSDIDMSNKNERVIFFPFIISETFLFLLTIYFLGGPLILYYALFGTVVGLLISRIINPYIKASGHVGLISAFVIPFVLRFGGWFYLMLSLIPLVAWSRIYLKKHSLSEVIAGVVIGGGLTIVVYFVVQYQM